MARFTAANAREMAARSVAVRKAAEAKPPIWPAFTPAQATPPAGTDPGISVACVRARLETLDALMSRAKSDREWDNLTRAYDRMFRVWCVLTKTPGPGNRKPAREQPRVLGRGPIAYRPAEPTFPKTTMPESTAKAGAEPAAISQSPPSPSRESPAPTGTTPALQKVPTPPTPATRRTVVTTAAAATAAMMPSVPKVSPNPKPLG